MFVKWVQAIVLLVIATFALAWIFGPPKVEQLGQDIQASLKSAGYETVNVEMDGFTARLSGEVGDKSLQDAVEAVARETGCSLCWNKGRNWHVVDNQTTVPDLPLQSPYTFNGIKTAAGVVTLSGFVPSQDAKNNILSRANEIFGGKVVDGTIQLARGAPDDKFLEVTESYMRELSLLDKGRFSQEGYAGLISGTSTDVAVRDRINQIGQELPSVYANGFAANIDVPQMAAQNVGEVQSEVICQTLFNDLKGDNRILFETGSANFKGAGSFDLLNSLASAANQCSAFRIQIDGHTDNVGDAAYNQRLSLARAETVKNYLADQQVEPNRMTTQGFGETDPRASNDTEEGKTLNRRIHFTVTRAQ